MDPKIGDAKDVLRRHFVNALNAPIRTPYYQHQLQILYEGDFFWWVVANALGELVKEEYLTVFDRERVPGLAGLGHMREIKFYANAGAVKTDRDETIMKRRVLRIAKTLEKYSSDENSRVLGKQLESLVESQLKILQFDILDKHTNSHNGKVWNKTKHNLDFIAKRNDLVLGIEVKNSLSVMQPEEIDVKIDMCHHLGIVPVFAVRWIKPYLYCIKRQGGFSWIFKTQILPFGQESLAKTMFKKLSVLGKKDGSGHRLEFPVSVRNDLPPKSVRAFERWIETVERNHPMPEMGIRCTRKPDGNVHMEDGPDAV